MYCVRCGTKLSDHAKFCNKCGLQLGTGSASSQSQPYLSPTHVPIYVKPAAKPGKGFGITSMILGLFAIFTSFIAFAVAMTTKTSNGYEYHDNFEGNLIVFVVTFSIFAILACIFAIVAYIKKYQNGITMTGLIAGVVSLAIFIFTMVSMLSSGLAGADIRNPSKLTGTWVATDHISTVTFKEDGEGELGGYGFPARFTYTTDGKSLTLYMKSSDEIINFTYEIKNNKLIWTNEEDGNVMTFTKRE